MAYTSDKKPGALNAATVLGDNDNVVVEQSGDVKKATLTQVEAKFFAAKTQTTTPGGTEVAIVRQTDGNLRQVPLANIIPADNITNAQISNSAEIADSKLAQINTAGKVTNNAVQAVSTNTANRIVTRDGSGNFAAGTVTATLSGNATTATTATTLATGRTIALTGDVTGTTGSFNGSANVSAPTTIANNAVTTAKILDANVTTAKVANDAIDNTKIRNCGPLSVIGRNLNSTGDPADIAAGTDGHVLRRSGTGLGFGQVVSAGIATGAVTATELASNAVTTAKILDANVTTAKIADSNVTTAKIADANVTDAKLATGAVTAVKLASDAVETAKINNSAVTNAKIANAAVTAAKLDGAQTGSAPIYGCRAWVNFNGITANNIAGTYTRTGTDVTVTVAAHGVLVGHKVQLDFTGGTPTAAADGLYTVTAVDDADNFHVTTAATGTSSGGTVALLRRQIRASGNVASVTYHNIIGIYTVNFSTALPDGDYVLAGFANFTTAGAAGLVAGNNTHAPTALACDVRVANSGNGVELNVSHVNVMFIR